MSLVLLLASMGLAEGTPVTTLHEVRQSQLELPWLAQRSADGACGWALTPEPAGRVHIVGCYTVPGEAPGDVVWGLTNAIRESGRWQLVQETAVPEQHALTQFWRGSVLTRDHLYIVYSLLEGEPQFRVTHSRQQTN